MSPFYSIMHAVFPHNALGLCSSVSEYGIAQRWPYKAEVVSISSWDTETQFCCLSSVKMDLVEYKWLNGAFYLIIKNSELCTKKQTDGIKVHIKTRKQKLEIKTNRGVKDLIFSVCIGILWVHGDQMGEVFSGKWICIWDGMSAFAFIELCNINAEPS